MRFFRTVWDSKKKIPFKKKVSFFVPVFFLRIMNYSLFSYSFKQYTGSNFVNYLRDIRMKEAKRLLAGTDMRIAEISQAVGYENEKHFMKLFKSSCGVSPSEYRRNMGLTG